MFCKETYYECYIKNKPHSIILKEINKCKRVINRLKSTVAVDGWVSMIYNCKTAITYYREYLKVAIEEYEKLGYKYIKTKKEVKEDELYNKLDSMTLLTLEIYGDCTPKTYTCVSHDNWIKISVDGLITKFSDYYIPKQYFVNNLRNIYFHETKNKYGFFQYITVNGKREKCIVVQLDGYYWNIELKFKDNRTKKIVGQGEMQNPFYFEELMNLIQYSSEIYECLFESALQIAKETHANQVDKAGVDYIEHPLYVSSLVDTTEEKIVALLHDVVEDSDMTFEELEKYGFTNEIIGAVKLLTKQDGYNYNEYLSNIKNNELARKVKIADLTHNSDITRIKNIKDKDLERKQKYLKAIEYLSS